ncbi:TolC family protein [Microscilla marina]|nr:TolC family protein [Microscilla marina]
MTNKLRISLTFCALWMLTALAIQVQAQITDDTPAIGTYSLDACLKYAYEHSEALKKNQLEIRKSEATVRETRSIGLPQVSAEARFSNAYIIPKSILPDGRLFGGPPGPIAVEFQPRYAASVTVTATQLLFDASYLVGLRASRVYKELSQKQIKQSKIDIAGNVTKAYYLVLLNKERIELLEHNFRRIDTLYKSTAAMQKNGFAEKIDVYRLQVSLNNIQTEINKTKALLDFSAKALKFQMGMPVRDSIMLSGSINDIQLSEVTAQEAESSSYKSRVEYSILETSRNLARLDIRNKKAAYYPRLVAFINYGSNAGSSNLSDLGYVNQNWFRNGIFGFTLSVPIFSGLGNRAKVEKARIEMQKIEQDFKAFERTYDFQVAQARQSLSTSLQDLKIQKQNMDLAKEVSRVANIKFQSGTGKNLDIIDAENQFKTAETNYYNALYNAIISKIDLNKAMGKLVVDK